MTLLLNYRPVLRQPTGIGVYAQGVLPALQQLPHVLIPGGDTGSASQRLRRLVWTQRQLPRLARQHRASLIFTPAPEGYLGRQAIPQVVMVHDLRPLRHPGADLQSLYFRAWVPALLRQCRHVLTNSAFTAAEIQAATGLPDRKISVIPLGYDAERFCPAPPQPGPVDPGSPYLLHVGKAYPHKNLPRLLAAFAQLAPRHPQLLLVLAGQSHPGTVRALRRRAEGLGIAERVRWLPYVAASELPGLYRGALALVYPSLWEGFGLPILEAMACGTPVLTSLGSACEETASDAALLVNPASVADLADGLAALVEHPHLRAQLRQRGLQHAAGYRWPATAAATAQVLLGLLG
jgi:glycosyltransferase involved in cell wall biosynthesis